MLTRFLRAASFLPILMHVLVAGQLIVWGLDRQSPFVLDSYTATNATPGGTVFFVGNVERNVSRKCSVEYSRTIYDKNNFSYDVSGMQLRSPDALTNLDTRSPSRLLVAVELPTGIPPGPATMLTVLNYRCNMVHNVWPIRVTLPMKFEVL